jgi:hypothetical protein
MKEKFHTSCENTNQYFLETSMVRVQKGTHIPHRNRIVVSLLLYWGILTPSIDKRKWTHQRKKILSPSNKKRLEKFNIRLLVLMLCKQIPKTPNNWLHSYHLLHNKQHFQEYCLTFWPTYLYLSFWHQMTWTDFNISHTNWNTFKHTC